MARLTLAEHRPPNEQERLFAEQYWIDLDPVAAAIRAGYPKDVADNAHVALMRSPQIAAEVQRIQTARSLRTHVTLDRVVMELSRIAFADPIDVFDQTGGGTDDDGNPLPTMAVKDLDKIPEDTRRAIESIEVTPNGGVKVKFASKLKALEMLTPHVQAMQPKQGRGRSRSDQEKQRDLLRLLRLAESRAKGLPQHMKAQTIARDGTRTTVEVTVDDGRDEQDVTP